MCMKGTQTGSLQFLCSCANWSPLVLVFKMGNGTQRTGPRGAVNSEGYCVLCLIHRAGIHTVLRILAKSSWTSSLPWFSGFRCLQRPRLGSGGPNPAQNVLLSPERKAAWEAQHGLSSGCDREKGSLL